VPVADPTFAGIHGIITVVLLFYALSLLPCLLGWAQSARWLGGAILLLFALLTVMIVIGQTRHLHFPIRLVLGLALAHFGAWLAVRERQDWLGPLLFLFATLIACRFGWSTAWGAGELWIGQAVGFSGAILLLLATLHTDRVWFGWLAPLGLLAYELWLLFPPALAASRFVVDVRWAAVAGSVLLAMALAWLLRRFVTQPARALA
jgi:peptidoglycan/LPS O-acetylase OafA/YrhL